MATTISRIEDAKTMATTIFRFSTINEELFNQKYVWEKVRQIYAEYLVPIRLNILEDIRWQYVGNLQEDGGIL